MADSELKSYLTCPVCLDTLTAPVSLGCHHNFCKHCLEEHWDKNNTRDCPVCRRRSSKDDLEVNFSLKQLSRSFRRKLQLSAPTHDLLLSIESPAPPQREPEESTADAQQQRSVCTSHPQVPPLFCLDDSRPLCPLCEFSLHPQHTVVSGEEADTRLRLQTLNEQKQDYEQLQQTYEKIQLHSEKQADHCERHIRTVFSGLHRFLQEEEQRAFSALKEEQLRQKQTLGPELEKVKEKLTSVGKSIKELERQLQTHTCNQQQSTLPQSTLPRPRPKAGLLLDQAKILGNLGLKVWTRMRREVTYSPVILDPNTAHGHLYLSDDLSAVGHGETEHQDVPDNAERFSHYVRVLGSVGYSSGTHQWDVDVGDHPRWAIGVAKESVEKKEKFPGIPEFGIWRLWHGDGEYTNGCKKKLKTSLKLKRPPEKIRVKLDCEAGTLSFYEADLMTPLYTHNVHKGSDSDTLFPCFSLGPAGGAKTRELRIGDALSEDSHSQELPLDF